VIEFLLPYPVSGNLYWRHFRGRTVRSKAADAYRGYVMVAVRKAGLFAPLEGNLSVTYTLHPVRPKDWAKREKQIGPDWADGVRCIDLGNCEKVASDCLNGVAIVDDSQFRRITLERGEPVEGGALRVRLEQATAQSSAN
jgi:crossover junction endodeoxyribonuclease RusA